MYEMKKIDGDAFVKPTNRRGTWSRPIVNSDGKFFESMALASKDAKVHHKTLKLAIENDEEVNGRLYAYASDTEIRRALRLQDYVEKQKDKGILKAKAPVAPPKASAPEPAPAPTASVDKPFFGVQWPDGTVTVRLTVGGTFFITRASKADLPPELAAATKWV